MTAQGKMTTTRVVAAPAGTIAILLTDDPAGRKPTASEGPDTVWQPAYNKTGMTTAIVHDYEPVAVPGTRQTRYVLITSVGRTAPLTGAQTLLLAKTQPTAT